MRLARLLILWLVLVIPGQSLAQDQGTPAGRPDADDTTTTSHVNASVFDEVSGLVRDYFFDRELRGIDWNAAINRQRPAAAAATSREQLSAAINGLLAELGTSHTAHFTRSDVAYYHLLDIFSDSRSLRRQVTTRFPDGVRYVGLGAFTRHIEGRTYVTGVWQGSKAAAVGLKTGDEIVAVDGKPFHPIDSFRGKADETVQLAVRRMAQNPVIRIPVVAEIIEPRRALLEAMRHSVRVFDHAGRRIGYVRIWSYAGRRYHELLIEELSEGRLRDAEAVVIDLRDGWGGAQLSYLDPFLPGPEMQVRNRDGEQHRVRFKWRKPVALLINGGTRSGKEILALGFRDNRIGPVVGERTAGAVVAGRVFLLSDDSLLYLAVADVAVNGKRLEGVGVEPTIPAPFDPRYAGGADPQRDRALEQLARLLDDS